MLKEGEDGQMNSLAGLAVIDASYSASTLASSPTVHSASIKNARAEDNSGGNTALVVFFVLALLLLAGCGLLACGVGYSHKKKNPGLLCVTWF